MNALTRVYLFGHDLISQDVAAQPGDPWQLVYFGYDNRGAAEAPRWTGGRRRQSPQGCSFGKAAIKHGSTRFLTNPAGAVTDTYESRRGGSAEKDRRAKAGRPEGLLLRGSNNQYDAFGELLAHTGTTSNRYRYCGEQLSEALGLYYLRARLMNPLTGRFWSADTYLGNRVEPGTLHKYLYCWHDSVNGLDPSGNIKLSTVLTTISIVATLASIAIPTIRSGGDAEVAWEATRDAIPLYGNARSAGQNSGAGNYGAGTLDLVLLAADLFTAGAVSSSVKAIKAGRELIPGARGVIRVGIRLNSQEILATCSLGNKHTI